ncbi:MAG: LolA family protein, partial [Planctomycetota bacterium]
GKALAQSNLENDVMNQVIREQNVRLKAASRATDALKIRRTIMKSPITRIAAAAAVIIVAALGINYFMAPSVTWAQVIEPILNARTVVFDMILGADDTGMVSHEIVVGSRMQRTMSNMPNMTMIIDPDNAQLLGLDNEAKTAVKVDISGDLGDKHRSYIKFVRQIIGQLQEGQVEELGEQIIDGQKAIVFVGKGQNEQVTIWADPQTAHPIRIEAKIGQEFSFTMKNFEFNADVDESLVSMDVPEGYTLQKTDIALGNSTEEDFVESLRIWAEIIGDGTYPEAVGSQSAMKEMPTLVQKVEAMQVSEEKGTQIGMSFARGLMFHQMLENQGGQWHYAGAGVKLGDADTAIFWYQPQGSDTYRVIYGDLSVKDAAPEDLPN